MRTSRTFGASRATRLNWASAIVLIAVAIFSSTQLATADIDAAVTPDGAPGNPPPHAFSGFLLRPSRGKGAAASSEVGALRASEKSALGSLGVNAERLQPVGSQGWFVARPGTNAMSQRLEAKLAATPESELQTIIADFKAKGFDAEPNYVFRKLATPNDNNWASVSAAMQRISAPQGWDISQGCSAVSVCVVDSGIQGSHPELNGNLGSVYNTLTGSWSIDSDDNGHGTHCAGTIGAVGNNGFGITGVAWRVRLLSCKFLGSTGTGTADNAIRCIRWCREQGAKIQSHSWGGEGRVSAIEDEIRLSQEAGSLVIVAAGNDNKDIDVNPVFPASISLPAVIAVGAVDGADGRAWFSNYGRQRVALFAPGVGIYSTYAGSSYRTLQGTSMATPHVAGAVAVLWAYKPSASASEIKAALLGGVDVVSGASLSSTGGRLNLFKSLQLLGAPSGTVPVPAPTPSPTPTPGPCASPSASPSASTFCSGKAPGFYGDKCRSCSWYYWCWAGGSSYQQCGAGTAMDSRGTGTGCNWPSSIVC